MFTFDLHVHTVRGSSDSSLSPSQLIGEAERIGLNGVCLADHGGGWNDDLVDQEFGASKLTVIPALEVTTNMGHVIAIGLRSHAPGIHKIDVLREVVDEVGGLLISAHPLRNFFNAPPFNVNLLYREWSSQPNNVEEASEHDLFSFVDLVEVTNGANSERENRFTSDIANYLGINGTGGSDSHSVQGIGKSLTVFENQITDQASLISELKAGKFYPAEGLNIGDLKPI